MRPLAWFKEILLNWWSQNQYFTNGYLMEKTFFCPCFVIFRRNLKLLDGFRVTLSKLFLGSKSNPQHFYSLVRPKRFASGTWWRRCRTCRPSTTPRTSPTSWWRCCRAFRTRTSPSKRSTPSRKLSAQSSLRGKFVRNSYSMLHSMSKAEL